MTVYTLINLMTSACSPSASFGDVRLWWVPSSDGKSGQLVLQRYRPARGIDLNANENGVMKVGLE